MHHIDSEQDQKYQLVYETFSYDLIENVLHERLLQVLSHVTDKNILWTLLSLRRLQSHYPGVGLCLSTGFGLRGTKVSFDCDK